MLRGDMPGTLVSRINPSGRGIPRLGFPFVGVSITPPPFEFGQEVDRDARVLVRWGVNREL